MAPHENTGAKRAPADPKASQPPAVRELAEDGTAVGADSALSEDAALTLLKRPDLSTDVLEQLAKNSGVLNNRKVKRALVEHPKTPRHISLPLIRQVYTFDLMQVALTPVVPADIKLAADDALCHRMEALSPGERLSLAHRGSGRIAGALLLDAEGRVMHAALENSRLTESAIIRALTGREASAAFVEAVAHHPQWSQRCEVRVALLRNEKTPLARAVEFARSIPLAQAREIVHTSDLPANIKAYLLKDLEKRASGSAS